MNTGSPISLCTDQESSELLPKGYVGKFRRDRNLNGGRVMIVTDCYAITDFVLSTATQNGTELVWATLTLKYNSKLVVVFAGPLIKWSAKSWNCKINYPRLRIPLGTTSKLLSFWAVILTQGVFTGKLD